MAITLLKTAYICGIIDNWGKLAKTSIYREKASNEYSRPGSFCSNISKKQSGYAFGRGLYQPGVVVFEHYAR